MLNRQVRFKGEADLAIRASKSPRSVKAEIERLAALLIAIVHRERGPERATTSPPSKRRIERRTRAEPRVDINERNAGKFSVGPRDHESNLLPPHVFFATAWVLSPCGLSSPHSCHAYPVQWTVRFARRIFRGNGSYESPAAVPGFLYAVHLSSGRPTPPH